MSRLLALIGLALALLQGSGLDVRLGDACAREHHQESASTDCPPECATCACCARLTYPPISRSGLVSEPLPVIADFPRGADDRLPTPPPRGILHVPRLTA